MAWLPFEHISPSDLSFQGIVSSKVAGSPNAGYRDDCFFLPYFCGVSGFAISRRCFEKHVWVV